MPIFVFMDLIALLPQLESDFLVKDSFGAYEITYGSTAITRLSRLFAEDAPLPTDIEAFLRYIDLEYSHRDRLELGERLANFLPELLEIFFQEPVWSEDTDEHPESLVMNTFLGYWTMLSHLNQFQNFMPESIAQKDVLMRFIKRVKPYKLNLAYQDLEYANLSYLEVPNPNFTFAYLRKATLLYANMPKAIFDNASLVSAQLGNACLPEGSWVGANLMGANLIDSVLDKGIWHKANLLGADFTQASLKESFLDLSNLQGADFTLADLSQCHLFLSDASSANFTKANLAYAKLTNVDLRETNLYRANFQYAELIETILQPKTFEKADFRSATLGERNQDFLKKQGAIT